MKLRIGDIVKHTDKFLASIAWHTGVPKNGIITKILPLGKPGSVDICYVDWCNGVNGSINSVNLMRCK